MAQFTIHSGLFKCHQIKIMLRRTGFSIERHLWRSSWFSNTPSLIDKQPSLKQKSLPEVTYRYLSLCLPPVCRDTLLHFLLGEESTINRASFFNLCFSRGCYCAPLASPSFPPQDVSLSKAFNFLNCSNGAAQGLEDKPVCFLGSYVSVE